MGALYPTKKYSLTWKDKNKTAIRCHTAKYAPLTKNKVKTPLSWLPHPRNQMALHGTDERFLRGAGVVAKSIERLLWGIRSLFGFVPHSWQKTGRFRPAAVLQLGRELQPPRVPASHAQRTTKTPGHSWIFS